MASVQAVEGPAVEKLETNNFSQAKKRWLILGQALKSRQLQNNNDVISVRRFSTFGLLHTKALDQDDDETGTWYLYTCSSCPDLHAEIRHNTGPLSIQDILGFNNTGNVCVWPSEEVLTYHCLQSIPHFRNKNIIEIGGGMTCLSGIVVSLLADGAHMTLTDGNEASVKNVDMIVQRNRSKFKAASVSSRLLKWGDTAAMEDLIGSMDIVLCADCFFFDDSREILIDLVHSLLVPGGEAIMFAPSRNGTFFKFASLAMHKFSVTVQNTYNNLVWDLHLQNVVRGQDAYDPDLHYPLYMHLKKPETEGSS